MASSCSLNEAMNSRYSTDNHTTFAIVPNFQIKIRSGAFREDIAAKIISLLNIFFTLCCQLVENWAWDKTSLGPIRFFPKAFNFLRKISYKRWDCLESGHQLTDGNEIFPRKMQFSSKLKCVKYSLLHQSGSGMSSELSH